MHRRAFDERLTRVARWAERYVHSLPDDKCHQLLLSNREGKREVRGRWIVDATGPAARFASHAGARRIVDDRLYGLARYATILDGSMTMQILLEADEDGWTYATRLPDDRVVVLVASEADSDKKVCNSCQKGYVLRRARLLMSHKRNNGLGDRRDRTMPRDLVARLNAT